LTAGAHVAAPASVCAEEIACQGDVADARKRRGPEEGAGAGSDAQTRGPGDLVWHASASIFDRFVVTHGGRRSPPGASKARAGAEGDEAGGGAAEGCSLLRGLHVFDTQTRRWVPFQVGCCNGGSRCCSAARFRHTLTRIDGGEAGAFAQGEQQAAVARRGEPAGYGEEGEGHEAQRGSRLRASAFCSSPAKSQVLLVLGGLPTQRARDELAPCALICSWNGTDSGDGLPHAGKGGSGDDGARGLLHISCCPIRVEDDASRSWVGEVGGCSGARRDGERRKKRAADRMGESDSRVGWIGHTVCEDGCGGVLVFGGVACRWSGLELASLDAGLLHASLPAAASRGSAQSTPAPSSDVLRLRLRAGGMGGCGPLVLRVDKLAVETTMDGLVRPCPAPRFAHSACLLQWAHEGQQKRSLMVQGGCVLSGDFGRASDAHLFDLFSLTWRRIPFASAEGDAPLSHAKHLLVPWPAAGAALPAVPPERAFRVLSIGGQMGCFSFGALCNRLVTVFRLDTHACAKGD